MISGFPGSGVETNRFSRDRLAFLAAAIAFLLGSPANAQYQESAIGGGQPLKPRAVQLAQATGGIARPLTAATARDLAFLQEFSGCVVERNAAGAAAAIDSDFRDTRAYRARMDKLVQSERGCLIGGTLRIRGVVLAGFLAEALVEKKLSISDPVAAVSHDATKAPIVARDVAEGIALCSARSKPVETVALLGTVPGSAEEGAAITALLPQVQNCTAKGVDARFNKPGLRAILALAFRRLATHTFQSQDRS